MKQPKPKQAQRPGGSIDWTRQVQWDLEYAKRLLLERGEVRPMFVMHAPEGATVIASAVGRDDRDRFYSLLRCLCIARNAHALTFIAEAW